MIDLTKLTSKDILTSLNQWQAMNDAQVYARLLILKERGEVLKPFQFSKMFNHYFDHNRAIARLIWEMVVAK